MTKVDDKSVMFSSLPNTYVPTCGVSWLELRGTHTVIRISPYTCWAHCDLQRVHERSQDEESQTHFETLTLFRTGLVLLRYGISCAQADGPVRD